MHQNAVVKVSLSLTLYFSPSSCEVQLCHIRFIDARNCHKAATEDSRKCSRQHSHIILILRMRDNTNLMTAHISHKEKDLLCAQTDSLPIHAAHAVQMIKTDLRYAAALSLSLLRSSAHPISFTR